LEVYFAIYALKMAIYSKNCEKYNSFKGVKSPNSENFGRLGKFTWDRTIISQCIFGLFLQNIDPWNKAKSQIRIKKGSYSIAGINVGVGFEIFQDLFQISSPGSSEEAGIVIRLMSAGAF